MDLFYRTIFGELFLPWTADKTGLYFNIGGWITVHHEGAAEMRHATMLEF